MTLQSTARRDALWRALGIGPRWVLRAPPRPPATDPLAPVTRDEAIGLLEWEAFAGDVAACRACPLGSTREHAVVGIGVAEPALLVVGEAPGAEEDARGEPFVGPAGRLLDAMLAAIGCSRTTNAYIANVLKCRPPHNRDPSPDEVAACRPYLRRQVELLAPRAVLLVGRFASATLLETDRSVASLRGREHRLSIGGRDVPAVVTFHPAYLLRSPEDKGKAWADLCLVRRLIERAA